jgi:hypothetical protein
VLLIGIFFGFIELSGQLQLLQYIAVLLIEKPTVQFDNLFLQHLVFYFELIDETLEQI